jgi:hypothetical protein
MNQPSLTEQLLQKLKCGVTDSILRSKVFHIESRTEYPGDDFLEFTCIPPFERCTYEFLVHAENSANLHADGYTGAVVHQWHVITDDASLLVFLACVFKGAQPIPIRAKMVVRLDGEGRFIDHCMYHGGDDDAIDVNPESQEGKYLAESVAPVLLILASINSRETVYRSTHYQRPAKQFLRRKNLPKLEHHTIMINPSRVEYAHRESSGSGSRKRLHDVRQHVRTLASGAKTVVRAHQRGDASLGIITSEYRFGDKNVAA